MEQSQDRPQINPETLEVVKQIKANGSFDKFRKDCFADIIAQPQFHDLSKSVEDYVVRFLKEQKPNSKKSFIRDKLRRSLNESYFLTSGINKLIEDTLEPKLESTFKPLITKVVESETTKVLSTSSSATTSAAQPVSNTENTTEQENSKTPLQKVSVEDFIPIEKQRVATPKLTPTQSIINKTKVFKQEKQVVNNEQKSMTVNKKPVNSHETSEKHLIKHKNSPVVESNKKFLNDEFLLEADPTNQYNFNWHLNSLEDIDYDDFSIASVGSSELSDLEEFNEMLTDE